MQLSLGARSSHVHTAGPGLAPAPTITFRHVLSAGTLNPTNPLRVIAHCDVDAAYAAFEAKRLGIDPHKVPIAVQQWNGLIAISYEARKYGITRHETIESAKAKCPDLIFAHVATYAEGADHAEYNEDPRPETHKVSLDPYRRESKKILDIFKKTCPAGAVEKASIDESFFDLTIEVRKALLEEYPQLRAPPPDSSAGLDTPLPTPPQDAHALWAGLGHLIPVRGDVGEGQDVNSATRRARELKRAEAAAATATGAQGRSKIVLPKGSRTMAPSMDTAASSLKALEAARADAQAEAAALVAAAGSGTEGLAAAAAAAAADNDDNDDAQDLLMDDDEEFLAPTSAQMDPAARRALEEGEEENDAQAKKEEEEEDKAKPTAEEETQEILAVEDVSISWQDVALAVGAKLMAKVRAAVKEELGYTTSAGIASNKTMAKLCSGWRKPNAQTIMRPAAVRNFLKVLPFQKIRFLGGKLGDAMANEWQSATVGDLWDITLEQMQARFGEESGWVYDVLRGIDHSEVKERVANKTMLASKNVRPVITTWAQGQHWLSILSTELAVRLAEARETEPNVWPRTIVLRFLRIGDTARSRQAAFPFARELSADVVRRAAEKLWRDAFGELAKPGGSAGGSAAANLSPTKGGGAHHAHDAAGENREVKPGIVTIALGFSGLEKAAETGQRRLDQTFFLKGAGAKQAAGPSSSSKRTDEGRGASDGPELVGAGGELVDGRSSSPAAEGQRDGAAERAAPASPARKKQKRQGPLEAMLQTQQQRSSEASSSSSSLTDGRRSSSPDARPPPFAPAPAPAPAPAARPKRKAVPSWTCTQCGEMLRPPMEALLLPAQLELEQVGDDGEAVGSKRKAPWPFDEDDADVGSRTRETAAAVALPVDEDDPVFNEEDAEAWLRAARVAHEDEHLARQLQEEENRRDRALAGSQAYAAARAAAAASSSQRPAKGSGVGGGSKGSSKGGGAGSSSSGGKGKNGNKPRGSGNGSIASFFSQQPRNNP
ncbi:N-acetyltransferase eso1 [Tilletia horrida]|nr:N-acetyltransferase eso1 [Tilletia horrida]